MREPVSGSFPVAGQLSFEFFTQRLSLYYKAVKSYKFWATEPNGNHIVALSATFKPSLFCILYTEKLI